MILIIPCVLRQTTMSNGECEFIGASSEAYPPRQLPFRVFDANMHGLMPDTPAATLHDVAAAVGVSHMTVHRALAGSPLVRPETCARVQAVATRLGYRPNLTARAMRNRRASRVGLLSSTDWGRTHLTIGLLIGMHDALHLHGLTLGLLRLSDEELLDHDLLSQQVRQGAGDGLIVAYESHQPQALSATLEELRIPTIWYNVRRDADCVYNDDQRCGREAAERLIALGHRRILYFCQSYEPDDPTEHYSSGDRCAGVAAACAAAGAQLFIQRGKRLTPERTAFAREALVTSKATAAVCYSGGAAWSLRQAASALGRQVPDDLSLISCDGDWGPYQTLTLAGYAPDFTAMGEQSAEALIARMAAPGSHVAPIRSSPVALPGSGTLSPPATK